MPPAVPICLRRCSRFSPAARRCARLDATRLPGLLIEVAETLHKRDQLSRRVTAALAGPNLAMILITLLLVGWGIEAGLKPVDRLLRPILAGEVFGDRSKLPELREDWDAWRESH